MAPATIDTTIRTPSIATEARRWSIAAALVAIVAVLPGAGSTHAQTAGTALAAVDEADWVVVEDPLLRSRGHDFVSAGDVVGNGDAFLVSRHASCGDDCLQILRSTDGLAWELIVIDGPGRWIADLAATDGGFVALVVDGPSISWPSADNAWYVYRSEDGRTWSGNTIEPTRPGDIIGAVASGPDRLVAVGCDTRIDQLEGRARREPYCRQAVVWTSTDGSSWTREEPESGRWVELASVAASGGTIVASGADFSAGRDTAGRPAVFTRSPDGTWSRTEPPGIPGGLLAVQTSPQHGFVLSPTVDWSLLNHGDIDFDAPVSQRYASRDGTSWTALPEPRLGADSPGGETRLTSLAESAAGTAAIATTGWFQARRGNFRESSRLWRQDGETWRSFALPQGGYAEEGGVQLAVGPGGRTLILNESGVMLIVSPDADDAGPVAVGPLPGRVAVPPSPLGSAAQTAFLSVNAVDQESCSRLRGRDWRRSAQAAVSALDCAVGDGDQRVRHFQFSSAADLDAWWSNAIERRERRGIPEVDDSIARCGDGRPASGAWQTVDGSLAGQVFCHQAGDEAVVAWTTPAALIGSEMRAKAEGLESLVASFAQGRGSAPPDAAVDPEAMADEVVPDPGPVDPEARRETELALRRALRPFACKPWRQEDEPFMFGAHAAVRCAAPAPGVSQLALFAFDDPGVLESFWAWRRGRISPLRDRAAACRDGREGATTWEHGSAACFVKREGRGVAQIRWTDTRTGTYGVLDATTADLPGLVDWWESNDPSSLAPVSVTPAEGVDDRLPDDTAGQLRYLRQRVESPSRCRPMSPTALARTEPGAIAGLDCTPTRRERNTFDMTSLRYLLFPSTRSMNAWWDAAREGAAPGGIARDSGSFGMCSNFWGENPVETAWTTRDGSSSGRVLCAPRRGISWTVARDLVAAETNASGWWFSQAHPDRVQRYRRLGPDERPQRPFAPPKSLRPLSAGIGEEATGQETWVARPTSGRGLPVGVVYPISLGHCDGPGFSPDVDGSFWQVTGGVDPDGKAVRRKTGYGRLGEGLVVEFVKISEDRAQLRTEDGYVYGYERHPGKRRFYPCA